MIRRFDEPKRPGIYYKTRPGAYGILQRGGQMLITHQSQPKSEYQLPGGGIDPGESALAALHREVREETGWAIRVDHKLGTFQRYCYMPDYDLWARKVCHIFLCAPVRLKGQISEPFHSAHWVSLGTASRILANGGDRHFTDLVARGLI